MYVYIYIYIDTHLANIEVKDCLAKQHSSIISFFFHLVSSIQAIFPNLDVTKYSIKKKKNL